MPYRPTTSCGANRGCRRPCTRGVCGHACAGHRDVDRQAPPSRSSRCGRCNRLGTTTTRNERHHEHEPGGAMALVSSKFCGAGADRRDRGCASQSRVRIVAQSPVESLRISCCGRPITRRLRLGLRSEATTSVAGGVTNRMINVARKWQHRYKFLKRPPFTPSDLQRCRSWRICLVAKWNPRPLSS